MSGEKLNPRGNVYAWYAIGLLSVGQTIASVDRQVMALLIEPMKADLGLSDVQIGSLIGLGFAVFYLVAIIPIGRLMDTSNRRTIIAVCMFLWSIMTGLCGLVRSFVLLFVVRSGVAIGEAALLPGSVSLAGDYLQPSQLGRAMGSFHIGLYAGSAFAFIAGGALIQQITGWPNSPFGPLADWQVIFLAASIPGLILAGLVYFTMREPARRKVPEGGSKAIDAARYMVKHRRAFLLHFLYTVIASVFLNATTAWFPAFLTRTYGLSVGDTGFVFGIIILVCATSASYLGGAYADALWHRRRYQHYYRVFVVAVCGAVVPGILYPLVDNVVLSVALAAVFYFFAIMPIAATVTGLQLLTPSNMRGQVTAMFMAPMTLIGMGISPAVVGVLSEYVYGGQQGLAKSLATVTIVLAPLAILAAFSNRITFAATAALAGNTHEGFEAN